jgi:hypothetical protein
MKTAEASRQENHFTPLPAKMQTVVTGDGAQAFSLGGVHPV